MGRWIKEHLNLLFIVFAVLFSFGALFLSGEWTDTVSALGSLKLHWVLACLLLIGGYFTARALMLRIYLKHRGYPLSMFSALTVTGIGQFYSAITPSSTGGQPMQVYDLHKRGVPVSVASAAVSIKFIGFQSCVLILGALACILYWPLVDRQLGPMKWWIFLGFFLNSLVIVALVFMMVNKRVVDRAAAGLLKILKRIKLIKDAEALEKRALETLEGYRAGLLTLKERPQDALLLGALSLSQVLIYISILYCVYRAFGLSEYGWRPLTALQLMLFISAAFVPLPGAAGAQEGGFYLFFGGIFPEAQLIPAMVAWRFFSYYLLLLLGMAAVVLRNAKDMREKGKRNHGRRKPD